MPMSDHIQIDATLSRTFDSATTELASWSDLIRRHLLRATRDQRPLGSKIFTTSLSFVFYRSDIYDAIDLNVTVMKRYNSISGALHIIPSQRYRSVHTINLQSGTHLTRRTSCGSIIQIIVFRAQLCATAFQSGRKVN